MEMGKLRAFFNLQTLILIIIVLFLLFIIFTAIVLYEPDLFRSDFLAITEKFRENVTTLFTAVAALATLILAYAAFRTIKISSEQKQLLSNQTEFLNEQIRFLREERLIKILDDVHLWANDMTNFRLELQKGKTQEAIRVFSVVHWTAVLKAQETNGKSLKRQAERIWPTLGSGIDEVLTNINQSVKYLLFEYQGKEQNKVALIKVSEINTSAQKLLTTADDIKSSVLSQ